MSLRDVAEDNVLYTGALGSDECKIQLCDLGSAHDLPEAGTEDLTSETASKNPGTGEHFVCQYMLKYMLIEPCLSCPKAHGWVFDCDIPVIYMPPELQRGDYHVAGRKVDSWAYGCLTLELLTRRTLERSWGELAHATQQQVDALRTTVSLPENTHPKFTAILNMTLLRYVGLLMRIIAKTLDFPCFVFCADGMLACEIGVSPSQ